MQRIIHMRINYTIVNAILQIYLRRFLREENAIVMHYAIVITPRTANALTQPSSIIGFKCS